MLPILRFICPLLFLVPALAVSAPRIAVLPSFSDMEYQDDSRRWLSGFDAALQAELLSGWDTEILSRSGLSAVVFEQKLSAAKNAATAAPLVLPAETLVLSVLDVQRNELRLHATRVEAGMKPTAPKVFRYRDLQHLANGLPREAAEYLAQVAKLERREIAAQAKDADVPRTWSCALLDPVSSHRGDEAIGRLAPLFRAALEQALASGERAVTLVEREKITTLLDESTLAASGSLQTNAASNLGRLAGADLILTPFVHPVSADELRSTLFAIDVRSGRILAARSWTGKPLDEPPAGSFNSLLGEAFHAIASTANQTPDAPAQRHAEADFLTGLSESFLGLRQNRATDAELALTFSDAALALAHDDPPQMRKTVAKLLFQAIPGPSYPLEMELYPNSERIIALKELIESGRLAMLHEQGRRIFELPVIELLKDGNDWDLRRLASYHLRRGEPEKAYARLTAEGRNHGSLAANQTLYERTAESLLAMGRYQECADFIHQRGRFNSYTTTLMLDALHASGQHEREFNILWINRGNTLGRAGVDLMARFLNLATRHGDPAASLVAFSSFGNAWMKNDKLLRVPLVRLRIAAGQKDKAISDARCGWLASRNDNSPAIMKELSAILGELGAKPIDQLPAPAEFVRFPQGARIDLFHDQTIDTAFAASVAQKLADCWGCEVHVIAIPFDPSRLSIYDPLTQSIEGPDLVRGFLQLTQRPGPLLQTMVLTNHKLHSTQRNYTGNIYSSSSKKRSALVVSTYYFKHYKDQDPRPLEHITAIAAAPLPGIERKLRMDADEQDPDDEPFQALPPDFMASNGQLHVAAVELGVSASTGALLRKPQPADWLEAAENFRLQDRELERDEPLEDTPYFSKLAAGISDVKPVIIQPKPLKRP